MVTGTNYTDTSGEYIWIQTKTWFSQFDVTQGDRILLSNITFPTTGTTYTDLINYVCSPSGHIVVDIGQGYLNGTAFTFKTGSNEMGYSNFIIIRNNFNDPTTGAVSLFKYGGSSTFNGASGPLKDTPAVSSGRLLNLSHQIQVIFRVITRDMDSATRLRPDNL